MRKKWTIEQRIKGQNQRAQKVGARHDLTIEQWMETLEYFNHKCAYCGKRDYEVIEHYLPVNIAGTTASNCIPACASCNNLKDSKSRRLNLYQNERVLAFLESKGVKIAFHIHKYKAVKEENVTLRCEDCGQSMYIPGLKLEDAQAYIEEYFTNTGYVTVSDRNTKP